MFVLIVLAIALRDLPIEALRGTAFASVLSIVLVVAALAWMQVATSIITESGLSYLGFGVQPPTPTWGNMLKNAQDQMTRAPWSAVFPGLMIFITVIAINFIGNGLRDALDPYKVN